MCHVCHAVNVECDPSEISRESKTTCFDISLPYDDIQQPSLSITAVTMAPKLTPLQKIRREVAQNRRMMVVTNPSPQIRPEH